MKPFSALCYTHRLSSDIGNNAVPVVERAIKDYKDRSVSWKPEERDNTDSSIGCLQHFSNTSHVSMSADSLMFYPLHITLLNFSEETRKRHISSAATVCANFPLNFECAESNGGTHSPENTTKSEKYRKITKAKLLQALN